MICRNDLGGVGGDDADLGEPDGPHGHELLDHPHHAAGLHLERESDKALGRGRYHLARTSLGAGAEFSP